MAAQFFESGGAPIVGNVADYRFGTAEHGWSGFKVVRWHAVEELSRPFRYAITMIREASLGEVDLDRMIDAPASLFVASQRGPRVVHGVIGEVEELDRTSTLFAYRVALVPHLWRARYRSGCRVYRDKSIVEIVSSVLGNRLRGGAQGLTELAEPACALDAAPDFTSFTEPRALFRVVLGTEANERLRDRAYRDYVTQYNESDLDFVSRILEEEGVTYLFEHGETACVLTITDRPGFAPLFGGGAELPIRSTAQAGPAAQQEVVRGFRPARRMRSMAVRVRDYSLNTPLNLHETELRAEPNASSEHCEYPAYEGVDDNPAAFDTATRRLARFRVERSFAEGTATARTLAPGLRMTLHDPEGLRADADVTIVAVESWATELLPAGLELDREPFGFGGVSGSPLSPGFEARFTAIDSTIPFVPAESTPKPRIHGIQPAVVTAEEADDDREINTNAEGDVRVRFPWDQREPEPGVPSSCWVMVWQHFAGVGFGAVWTPRVGNLVSVAFVDGNPDTPVVIGRGYSDQTPCPFDTSDRPTVSAIKTQSVPGGGGFNELWFDDAAGAEVLGMRAERDLVQIVQHDALVQVGKDQTSKVAGGASASVGGDSSVSVKGSYSVDAGTSMQFNTKDFSVTGTSSIHLTTGDERLDKSSNHIVQANGVYVHGDEVVQVTGPRFDVFCDRITLKAGDSIIQLDGGGISITSPGVVTVNGSLIKLNS